MKNLKKIPDFSSEKEEREFWLHNDSTDYIDFSSLKRVGFPDLRPSTKTISLRLPERLLNKIKAKANEEDVPYQSLIKMVLGRMFL